VPDDVIDGAVIADENDDVLFCVKTPLFINALVEFVIPVVFKL
jgi:hypothetical protein